MRTKHILRAAKAAVFPLLLGGLAAGCSKEASIAPAAATQASHGSAKTDGWFIARDESTVGTFKVYIVRPTCYEPYGNITSYTCEAPNSLVTGGVPTYVRLTNSNCSIDAGNLRLDRGASLGAWGPWYLVVPQFGPTLSTRKNLKFRLKNMTIPGAIGSVYDQGITYNGTTNTWNTTSAVASGMYEVQEVTGLSSVCVIRE